MIIRIRKKGADIAWKTKRAQCCSLTGTFGPWLCNPEKK